MARTAIKWIANYRLAVDGTLGWSESSLMRRSVRFSLCDDAHAFKGTVATMHFTRGSTAVVTLERIQPAS